MTQNSALSLKLGWVHRGTPNGPWLRSRWAQAERAVCRVVARSVPCRRPSTGRVTGVAGRVVAVSQAWPAVSQLISRHTQHQGHACARRVARCRACRSAPAPCRRALSTVSQPLAALYRDTTVTLLSTTIQFCIMTQLPATKPLRANAPLALRAGRPYRGPLMAVSQGYIAGMLDHIVAPAACPTQPPQPCVTIQSIVS